MKKILIQDERQLREIIGQDSRGEEPAELPEQYPCVLVYIEIDDGNFTDIHWEYVYEEDFA